MPSIARCAVRYVLDKCSSCFTSQTMVVGWSAWYLPTDAKALRAFVHMHPHGHPANPPMSFVLQQGTETDTQIDSSSQNPHEQAGCSNVVGLATFLPTLFGKIPITEDWLLEASLITGCRTDKRLCHATVKLYEKATLQSTCKCSSHA